MTDDAVRYVRSGDGQVAYRVVGSGPSAAGVPGRRFLLTVATLS